jgi:hypothetical protein
MDFDRLIFFLETFKELAGKLLRDKFVFLIDAISSANLQKVVPHVRNYVA